MSAFAELPEALKRAREGKAGKRGDLERREGRLGLLFLSPWIVGFLAFYLIPMGASLVFSFAEFDLTELGGLEFVGLKNYRRLFTDSSVRQALVITLRFMLISLPVGIIWPTMLAALLNSKALLGKRFFRTLFYMPYIIPVVSVAYIWQGFLNANTGWLNLFLESIGLPAPNWLGSTTWIYPALVIAGLWGVGNAMLYTLAGMQGVPTELYEAARVDGAGWIRSFVSITIPMISPVIFYNLILLVIGLFQYFGLAWILGGPNSNPSGATLFYNVYLYKQAFVYSNMGYGATLAWLLFIMALAVTLVLFGTAKYWVYYAGGER